MFDLGMNLRNLRKKKKWTQKHLADMLHVSEASVCKYESNMTAPTIDTLRSYSALFNVSMDELLGMEHKGTLPLYGLTDEQAAILRELRETFRGGSEMNAYEVIGRAAVEIARHKIV